MNSPVSNTPTTAWSRMSSRSGSSTRCELAVDDRVAAVGEDRGTVADAPDRGRGAQLLEPALGVPQAESG